MRALDPIFVVPRYVARDWGRKDLGEWAGSSANGQDICGEAWVHDPLNDAAGERLGRRLAQDAVGMLGDLGRAPARMRLVFPGRPIIAQSSGPTSFWTILEPGYATSHRAGERIRAYEGAGVPLAPGSVALEVSACFQPRNDQEEGPSLIRLPPVSRRRRATLFRDEALSVEMWRLPPHSLLCPDGETCHVVMSMTPGIAIDGRDLPRGQCLFVPAWGRGLNVHAATTEARLLVAYPDSAQTAIWRHGPGPDQAPETLPAPISSPPGCVLAEA
jgi:hypothetical protein